MPSYQFPTATIVSRRLILFSTIAIGIALLLAVRSSSPLVVDVIVRAIELFTKAPFMLLFIVALLVLTAGAGTWATVTGFRTHGRRIRLVKRHKLRR